MTKAKEKEPYRIHGTDSTRSPREKRTKAELARAAENTERRTARCRVCGNPRPRRSFPICDRCVTR